MSLIGNYNFYKDYKISLEKYFNILYYHRYRNDYTIKDVSDLYVFSNDKKYVFTFSDITKDGILIFEKYNRNNSINYFDIWEYEENDYHIKTFWGEYKSMYIPYNDLIKMVNKELRNEKLYKICQTMNG